MKPSEGSVTVPASLPLHHSLKGAFVASLRLPTDDSYVDVFTLPLWKAVPEGVALPLSTDEVAVRIVVYTQGRQLSRDELASIFSSIKCPAHVEEHGSVDGFRDGTGLYYAVLRFDDRRTAARSLVAVSSFPDVDGDGNPLGIKGWLAAHQSARVNARTLQAAVDKYVSLFDEAETTVCCISPAAMVV